MTSLGIRHVMRGGVASGRAAWFTLPGASAQLLVVRGAVPSFPHARNQALAVVHLAAARPGSVAGGSISMAISPSNVAFKLERSLSQKVAELRGGGQAVRFLAMKASTHPVAPIPRLPQRFMSTAPKPEEGGGMTIKERMKNMVSEYGKIVIVSHTTIWALSLIGIYAWLSTMDISIILNQLPASIASKIDPSAGAFAIAFILVKISGPPRMLIDIALAPILAGYLRGTWLAGPLGLRTKAAMQTNGQPLRTACYDAMASQGRIARRRGRESFSSGKDRATTAWAKSKSRGLELRKYGKDTWARTRQGAQDGWKKSVSTLKLPPHLRHR
ncbi:hypothetical protein T484DRAFT_1940001 [Baffinella frigidus]|nr:hypothetical protein T484DRAFT_1940001 [Cryptophyta sp. CCMP2293]|mmetsp:Transcript_25862/g.61721  ORF Transcript_25862/g.61721 Transcript_25862/m.61721 type:complete len:329 (+) Transcript_25862:106-1092(+)